VPSGPLGRGPHKKGGDSIGAAVPKARRGWLGGPRPAERLAVDLPWGAVLPQPNVMRRNAATDRWLPRHCVLRTHNVCWGREPGQVSRCRDSRVAVTRAAL